VPDPSAPDGVPDDVLAELLAAPFDRFVAERDARAKALRADGRADEAAAVKALRKPPKVVWELDQLARDERFGASRFAKAATAARKAQARGAADAMRAATKELREAIGTLAGDRLELADALRAAAADEEAVDALRAGRLYALPEGGALGPLPSGPPPRRRGTGPSAAEKRQSAEAAKRLDRARATVERREQEVADLEARLDEARARLTQARDELDAAGSTGAADR
jgi:hypothetical protein